MRLDKYITEDTLPTPEEVNKARKLIVKNCSDITRIYRKYKKVFYRGTMYSEHFLEKSMHQYRNPRNTDIEIHEILNKFFKRKFGWDVRNGISVSNSLKQAQYFATTNFGNLYVFFPVNGFKYCWSKRYTDLYNDLSITHIKTATWTDTELEDWMNKYMGDFKRAVNTYTDKDLEKVLRMGDTSNENKREVMFKSSKYYLVSLPLFGMLNT